MGRFEKFKWLLTKEQKLVFDEFYKRMKRAAPGKSLGTFAIKNAVGDEEDDPFGDELPRKSGSKSSSIVPFVGRRLSGKQGVKTARTGKETCSQEAFLRGLVKKVKL